MTIPATEKVIERLVHEGALFHNRIQGRRRRITLAEAIEAGREEPRVFEIIPALLLVKPGIFSKLKRDLCKHCQLKKLVENFDTGKAPASWRGIPFTELKKQQKNLYRLWQSRHQKTKWRALYLRVSDEDVTRLEKLAARKGHYNKSETIRELIAGAPL